MKSSSELVVHIGIPMVHPGIVIEGAAKDLDNKILLIEESGVGQGSESHDDGSRENER